MRRLGLLRMILTILSLASVAFGAPVQLRCEYLENPLGIDAASPQLSWRSDNSERSWKQAAYELLVASTGENLSAGNADIWDSGKVNSAESVGVRYGGPSLGLLLSERTPHYPLLLVVLGGGRNGLHFTLHDHSVWGGDSQLPSAYCLPFLSSAVSTYNLVHAQGA